jgi:polyisoprenoid-binding protein YceI
LEDITAINTKVSAVFDSSNNDLVFQLRISDFVFPNSLMQEHFNENYLESEIYPESTFSGKVVSSKEGEGIVQGNLKIHGEINPIKVSGVMIKNKGSLNISAEFNIKLKDYDIKIPKIVMYKIAEEIDIAVNIQLKEVK